MAGGLDSGELIRLLERIRHPLRPDDLLRLLDLSRRDRKALEARLFALEAEGRVVRLPGGKWTDTAQARAVSGVLSVQRSGVGFVTPDRESGRSRPGPDIFVHPAFLGDARHRDRVRAVLVPGRRGEHPEGRIVEVLERGVCEFTVQVESRSKAGLLCRPADPRLRFRVEADPSDLPAPPRRGELLVVEAERKIGPDLWRGRALRALGREDDAHVQEELVRLNHDIPSTFSPDVQAAAEAARTVRLVPPVPFSGRCSAQRQDLREFAFVTVDGDDARDFDDAVCVIDGPGGTTVLLTAVADVSLYVRPGDVLDREAAARGNSCYFPASVSPMLPEVLSTDLCSLRPGEERPVMAVRIVFDAEGRPEDTSFFPGLIRSRARLTYDRTHRALERKEAPARAELGELLPMLEKAYDLAQRLRRRRLLRGSLDFDVPEPFFVLDEDGRVVDVVRRERFFSHRLIEEFMLATNEAAARFLTDRGVPFPYRVHPEPDLERLNALFRTLAAAGLADLPSGPDASTLRGILDAARGTPQEFLISRLTLRSMMQARYAPERGTHFGLASACYCHFTSPIRRYADLLVHRALKHALGAAEGGSPLRPHKLLALCGQCNTRERTAQEAEREIGRRAGCLLLRDRLGECFAAVISGVCEFGFFVELKAVPLEGMVRLEALPDWFVCDMERQELIGRHSGRVFRIGQELTVRLEAVNLGRLEITFMPADREAVRHAARTGRRGRRSRFSDRGSVRARRKRSAASGTDCT